MVDPLIIIVVLFSVVLVGLLIWFFIYVFNDKTPPNPTPGPTGSAQGVGATIGSALGAAVGNSLASNGSPCNTNADCKADLFCERGTCRNPPVRSPQNRQSNNRKRTHGNTQNPVGNNGIVHSPPNPPSPTHIKSPNSQDTTQEPPRDDDSPPVKKRYNVVDKFIPLNTYTKPTRMNPTLNRTGRLNIMKNGRIDTMELEQLLNSDRSVDISPELERELRDEMTQNDFTQEGQRPRVKSPQGPYGTSTLTLINSSNQPFTKGTPGVGILDLVGKEGNLYILQEDGYIIKQIPSQNPGQPQTIKIQVSALKNNVNMPLLLSSLFIFGGRLYGISDQSLYTLNPKISKNQWVFVPATWAPPFIVSHSATSNGNYLWLSTNTHEYIYTYAPSGTPSGGKSGPVTLVRKFSTSGNRRIYGVDEDTYLELDPRANTAIQYPGGMLLSNVKAAAIRGNDIIRVLESKNGTSNAVQDVKIANNQVYYLTIPK